MTSRRDLDPDAECVELPRLLLQPLVENAIRHGALARPEGGEVRVATRRTGAGVTLVIQDNGPASYPVVPRGSASTSCGAGWRSNAAARASTSNHRRRGRAPWWSCGDAAGRGRR